MLGLEAATGVRVTAFPFPCTSVRGAEALRLSRSSNDRPQSKTCSPPQQTPWPSLKIYLKKKIFRLAISHHRLPRFFPAPFYSAAGRRETKYQRRLHTTNSTQFKDLEHGGICQSFDSTGVAVQLKAANPAPPTCIDTPTGAGCSIASCFAFISDCNK